MAKSQNATRTAQVTLSLSEDSVRVLGELAKLGIYGKNEAEVAGRFVDKALEQFTIAPRYKLPLRKTNRPAQKREVTGLGENQAAVTSRQKSKKLKR
jgi:hypothetical protein